MRHTFIGLIGVAAAVLCASTAMAQTAKDIRGPRAQELAAERAAEGSPVDGNVVPERFAFHGDFAIGECLPGALVVRGNALATLDTKPERDVLVVAILEIPRDGSRQVFPRFGGHVLVLELLHLRPGQDHAASPPVARGRHIDVGDGDRGPDPAQLSAR